MEPTRADPEFLVRAELTPPTVEAWSTQRVPFEPKGWRLRFRDELRRALKAIAGVEGDTFAGAYAGPTDGSDAENLLFYNVGIRYLPRAARHGLRFTRGEAIPPSPRRLAATPNHYYRYSFATPDAFSERRAARVAASWSVALEHGMPDGVAPIWAAMKLGRVDVFDSGEAAPERFGVRAKLTAPLECSAAYAMKPVLDGVISALHHHDGTSIDSIAQALAPSARLSDDATRTMLLDPTTAPLGRRRLLWRRAAGVQWNPRDEDCWAAELVTVSGTEWRLEGALYRL